MQCNVANNIDCIPSSEEKHKLIAMHLGGAIIVSEENFVQLIAIASST